jgi:hypothetical protein
VKEVLAFSDVPDRRALWHHRRPDIPEFGGKLGPIPRACGDGALVRPL